MGLLNKIKNLFMDDEIVEVTQEMEVENKIEVPKLPTFMKDKLEKEEKENAKITLVKDDKRDDDVSDRNLLKTTPDFKFPIAFDEKDFVATRKTVPPKRRVAAVPMYQNSSVPSCIRPVSGSPKQNARAIFIRIPKTVAKVKCAIIFLCFIKTSDQLCLSLANMGKHII